MEERRDRHRTLFIIVLLAIAAAIALTVALMSDLPPTATLAVFGF